MIEISVIVPIYNVEKYLEKCLLSIQNQEFEAYEVILVDDGSKDNSKKIAEAFVEKDSEKFKLICQENQGLSGARNTGMKYALGKYICFVDSDDYIEPDYLRVLYESAQTDDVDLVFCAFRSVDEDGKCVQEIYEKNLEPKKLYNIEENKEILLIQNAAWNKLYKRDIIEQQNLEFTVGAWYEDVRFVRKYMLYTSKCVYCNQILYNYLIRSGSIMNSMKSERNSEIIDAIDEVIDFYNRENQFENYKEEIEFLAIDHIYISALVRMIRANDKKQRIYIKEEFEKRFPEYKNNKYISKLDRNRYITYQLLNLKWYKLIEIIFKLKK